jgi:predicted lysophospholipase L1 biosynthesis ABC-type transport system permease subunit
VIAALEAEGAAEIHVHYLLPVEGVKVGGEDLQLWAMEIEGRTAQDVTWDLALTGEPWGTVPDGAYLPAHLQSATVDIGAAVVVQTAKGDTWTFTVAGFYTPETQTDMMMGPSRGMLVPVEAIDPTDTALMVTASMPAAQLEAAAARLGLALPEALVMSAADISDLMTGMLRNLFSFAIAVAGLALVAGAVLIANAVGLAMVERRREIGILKAVGFNSGDVLKTFLLEHGLLGLLGGAAGTVAVAMMIRVLNAVEPQAQLSFRLLPGLGITLVAVAIALLSAALVAWHPTRVRPLAVLRDE